MRGSSESVDLRKMVVKLNAGRIIVWSTAIMMGGKIVPQPIQDGKAVVMDV